MKSKSIDLNEFMLHHVEKVILVVGVALLGTFFWLGYSTPIYKQKTPKQLADDAQRAGSYIQNPENWNKIAEFRRGDADANERIAKAETSLVDLEKREYVNGPLLGVKAKSLGLRFDPDLIAPVELVAVPFNAPLLINKPKGRESRVYPISTLADATAVDEDEADKPDRPGNGGLGGLGDDQQNSEVTKKKKKKGELVLGDTVPEIQQQYIPGVRPKVVNLNTGSHRSRVFGVVGIYGMVKLKNQWVKYDQVFKDATAYYPERDRPKYTYVEVQRRELKNGEWTEWGDVSGPNRKFENDYFPSGMINGAPEVIAAENYDPVLTKQIPPISMIDYRQFATHPNGKMGLRDFGGIDLGLEKEVPEDVEDDEDFASLDSASEEDEETDETKKAAEEAAEKARRASTRGNQKRTGSNFAAYTEIMKAKEPSADYKLLRFFDMRAVEGASYQYRVRLWLSDPNNEDKDGQNVVEDKRKQRGSDMSAGMAGLGGDGDSGGGGDASGQKEEYIYVALASTMKDISVRERLRKPTTDMPLKTLKNSRATDWAYVATTSFKFAEDGTQPAEAETVEVAKDAGEFYAGRVLSGRLFKTQDGKDYVQASDPSADLVLAQWSPTYGTRMPGRKIVRRGEVLNFKPDHPIHMLHPIDWSVRKIEAKDNPVIKTDAVVVDMIGGQKLAVSGALLDYNLPGEVLIMDSQGNFRVQNDGVDVRAYRQALFLDDEIAEVGRRRAKDDDENDSGDLPGN